MTLINHLKAIGLLLAIVVVWLGFVLLTPHGWWQIVMAVNSFVIRGYVYVIDQASGVVRFRHRFAASQFKNKVGNYTFTLWLSNDQYINSVFGGSEDHSISGRVGYLSRQGNAVAKAMEKAINLLFWLAVGQQNHCQDSIEWDEIDGYTPKSYNDFKASS